MPKKPRTTTFEGRRVTAAGKRHLTARAPQLREKDAKLALLLRAQKTSERATRGLRAVQVMTAPFSQLLSRRRDDVRSVLEDASGVERECAKRDAAFFGVASHSKKRPDNVVLGRLFDGTVLDMFEFGVLHAGPAAGVSKLLGTKPCVAFVGHTWDSTERGRRLRNFFADLFRGPDVDGLNLAGLEHVVVCALDDDAERVQIAPHRLRLRKNPAGGRVPNVLLEPATKDEHGPLTLAVRRDHAPSLDLWKAALKQPKALKPKKRKNISSNDLTGETRGRLHLGRQDLDSLQTRKVKALKKKPAEVGSPKENGAAHTATTTETAAAAAGVKSGGRSSDGKRRPAASRESGPPPRRSASAAASGSGGNNNQDGPPRKKKRVRIDPNA